MFRLRCLHCRLRQRKCVREKIEDRDYRAPDISRVLSIRPGISAWCVAMRNTSSCSNSAAAASARVLARDRHPEQRRQAFYKTMEGKERTKERKTGFAARLYSCDVRKVRSLYIVPGVCTEG